MIFKFLSQIHDEKQKDTLALQSLRRVQYRRASQTRLPNLIFAPDKTIPKTLRGVFPANKLNIDRLYNETL
ncbi:MAG: hypothetical protein CSB32_01045 [Desulfobacterales bacterium]|nr:MAG: hypothetical protein CSB32_01045 [Desulfobacterales bacterium]